MNAIEREFVPTRVLNPNASEARYKPKQRSYIKTKQKKLAGKNPRGKDLGEKTGDYIYIHISEAILSVWMLLFACS